MSRAAFFALACSFAFFACSSDALSPTMPDLVVVAPPDLGPPAPSGIGNTCMRGTCAGGQVCIPDGPTFPGGYCTQNCVKSSCPSDATCVPFPGSGRYCLVKCASDSDCRSGYACDPTVGACAPASNGMDVPPGTNNGQACVMPVQDPSMGKGGIFGTDVEVSASLGGIEAETELAVDPVTHHVVVAYIAESAAGQASIGVTLSDSDGAMFHTPLLLPIDTTVDLNHDQSDPVVAVDPKGNFYVAWVGFDRSGGGAGVANMNMYVARSSDGGVSWPQLAIATPADEWLSGGFLDKPWIAAGPDGALWLTWDRQASAASPVDLRMARSTDGGMTWSAPVTISDSAARPDSDRNLCQIQAAADGSALAAWVEIASDQWGATDNGVFSQRFDATGMRVGQNVQVTAGSDSPTFEDPSVALFGGQAYVGFISGAYLNGGGRWDVRVAASLDGGATWQPSVKVNDDPTCATHFHHQIAVDGKGDLHAIWYDNRYHPAGNVFHAVSPAAGAGAPLAFGKNEFVNNASFQFTTRRDVSNWLGDYLGLTTVGDEIYASWTDPRGTNVSHIYFARGTIP